MIFPGQTGRRRSIGCCLVARCAGPAARPRRCHVSTGICQCAASSDDSRHRGLRRPGLALSSVPGQVLRFAEAGAAARFRASPVNAATFYQRIEPAQMSETDADLLCIIEKEPQLGNPKFSTHLHYQLGHRKLRTAMSATTAVSPASWASQAPCAPRLLPFPAARGTVSRRSSLPVPLRQSLFGSCGLL